MGRGAPRQAGAEFVGMAPAEKGSAHNREDLGMARVVHSSEDRKKQMTPLEKLEQQEFERAAALAQKFVDALLIQTGDLPTAVPLMALGAKVAAVLEKAGASQASELWLEVLAFFVGEPAVVLVGGSEEFKAKGDEMHGKIAAILADVNPEPGTAAHGLVQAMCTLASMKSPERAEFLRAGYEDVLSVALVEVLEAGGVN
jgi:hypothetical protein